MQPFGIMPNIRQPQAPNYGQPSAPRNDGSAPFAPSFPESSPDTSPRGQFSPNPTPFPTQAPSVSPQMLDQYNRVGEDANARNIGRQNFLNSVAINNARQRAGQDALRGSPSPGNAAEDAMRTPSAPSIIVGGGRGGPFVAPSGSNITGIGGTNMNGTQGVTGKAAPGPIAKVVGGGQSQVPNLNWTHPATQPSDPQPYITTRQPQTLATVTPPGPSTQPTTQPSAPSYNDLTSQPVPNNSFANGTPFARRDQYNSPGMTPVQLAHANNAAYDQANPGANRGQVQWTHQQAQETWKNQLQNSGGDLAAAGDAFHDTMGKYGIDGYKLLTHYADSGIDLNNAQRQIAPVTGTAPRIPVSMLGPDNGMERFPNSGGSPAGPGAPPFLPSIARQSVPGPTVSPAAPVTPGSTAPFRGSTPIGDEFKIGAPAANLPMANMPNSSVATNVAMGAAVGNGATPNRQTRQAKGKGATAKPAAQASAAPSDADIAFTAQKHGISPEEVRRRIGG